MTCGCHMDPVDDTSEPCDLCSEATEANNGIGWKIVRCPLHEAAPDLLATCKEVLRLVDMDGLGEPRIVTLLEDAIAKTAGSSATGDEV